VPLIPGQRRERKIARRPLSLSRHQHSFFFSWDEILPDTASIVLVEHCAASAVQPRTASMISLKTSPYVLVACAVFSFVILFSLGHDRSAASWAIPKTSFTSSSTPNNKKPPNYRSASFNRLQPDTTSELGRASNATLGVCDLFFFYCVSLPP
jgi:hypothetical protein